MAQHQARPLRREDGLLHRCSYRLGDTDVAPPYELVENALHCYSLRDPNPHFTVNRNVITILTTDASPANRIPQPRTLAKGRATIHSRAIQYPEGKRLRWLREIGEIIAAVMFGLTKAEVERASPPFALSDFPEDMVFYLLRKTHSDRPHWEHTDFYLRSYKGMKFATPMEFARHAMWFMEGLPKDDESTACLCKNCHRVIVDLERGKTKLAPQEPISRELRLIMDRPLARDLRTPED